MKINIIFPTKAAPTGGGNQFLKAIKEYLRCRNHYSEDPESADIILFNSHHCIDRVIRLKSRFANKIFFHRIDGPMRLYNTFNDRRDSVTYLANRYVADATIFQSSWSRNENYRLGLRKTDFETTITNAPNPTIFNRQGKIPFARDRKLRLIATSWSSNWKKGFEVYQWLDENLDFGRYEMTFVGNSPVAFQHIKHIPLLKSEELAAELKRSDIFIFASQVESCSNSLLEALHCGLSAIGYNGSSNPEIIGKGGEFFKAPSEIPMLLEKLAHNYESYQKNISVPTFEEVGRAYYGLMQNVYETTKSGEYAPKRLRSREYAYIMATIYRWKLSYKWSGVIRILRKVRSA